MTLKIETASAGEAAVLRLAGRIQADDVGELRARIRSQRTRVVLDLDQVTLVDLEVVDFLVACEGEGVELLHRSPYIQEWMGRERGRLPVAAPRIAAWCRTRTTRRIDPRAPISPNAATRRRRRRMPEPPGSPAAAFPPPRPQPSPADRRVFSPFPGGSTP